MKLTNLIVYFVGEFLSKAAFMLLLPLFAHFLTVSEYGVVSLFLPIFTYLAPSFSFGLQSSQMRYYFHKHLSLNTLCSNILIVWFVPVLILSLVLCTVRYMFYTWFEVHQALFFKAFITLALASFVVIAVDLYRARSKPVNFVVANCLYRILIVAMVFVSFMFVGIGLGSVINSFLIITVAFFFCFFFCYLKRLTFSLIDSKLMMQLLAYGLPIALISIFQYVISMGGRYLLGHQLSHQSLGYYSMAVSVTQIVYLVNAVFIRAWIPDLFSNLSKRSKRENQKYLTKASLIYTTVVCAALLAFLPFSRLIFYFLGGYKYSASLPLVPILLISYAFQIPYTMSIDRLYFMKKTGVIFIVFFLTSTFFVGVTCGLLRMGLQYYSPCIASVCSQLLLGQLMYYLAWYYDQIRLKYITLITICLSTVCMLLVGMWCNLLIVQISFFSLFCIFAYFFLLKYDLMYRLRPFKR